MNELKINWPVLALYVLGFTAWVAFVVAVVTASPDWQIIGLGLVAAAFAFSAGAVAGGSSNE